jgi:hypothetical protein
VTRLLTVLVVVWLTGCSVQQEPAFPPPPAAGLINAAPCLYPAWVEYRPYVAGSIVSYQGKLYIAKFDNPGYIPTVSTYYWAEHQCAKQ